MREQNNTPHHLDSPSIDERFFYLRHLIVQALEGGGCGHIGSSMSLAEIVRVLYDHILLCKPEHSDWDRRNRFILSKGHSCFTQACFVAIKWSRDLHRNRVCE